MSWLDTFGAGDAWERPRPPLGHGDVVTTLAALAFVGFAFELARSFADMSDAKGVWQEYLAVLLGVLPLLPRRRHPALSLLAAYAVFFGAAHLVPEVGMFLPFQLLFFTNIYTAVAWTRDRRQLALLVLFVLVSLLLWVGWDVALGSGIDHYLQRSADYHPSGILPRVVAWVMFQVLLNVAFVVGAVAMGQVAWRQARDQAGLAAQAATIARQADELQEQAVVDERLRIARELHDVVAHHVSVIGIQAAGARKALATRPDLAETALSNVEESSRQAVAQMRGLLGALRATGSRPEDRGPQPTLAQLPTLVDEVGAQGLAVDLRVVEATPGQIAALPLPLQLSLYRTIQEALTNVRRHSTARRASVVLRLVADGARRQVEAEVLDDGRPRGGTSGTGLGLLGLRERIASHGGTSEIGPRVTGGYRVRVRFPVPDQAAS